MCADVPPPPHTGACSGLPTEADHVPHVPLGADGYKPDQTAKSVSEENRDRVSPDTMMHSS